MSQVSQARTDIEATLIAKAQADPAFRQALLKNPKAAIEKEFGTPTPGGVDLIVLEETATTNYLVLPATAEGELSESTLDAVAGGDRAMQVKSSTSTTYDKAADVIIKNIRG